MIISVSMRLLLGLISYSNHEKVSSREALSDSNESIDDVSINCFSNKTKLMVEMMHLVPKFGSHLKW